MWKDLKNSNKSTTYGLDSTIWPLKFGALALYRAVDGLVSGHRVNLLERYDYPS